MYQKIIIVGRLGRDPEMRYTPAGKAVTSFSVATDRQYPDQSGKLEKKPFGSESLPGISWQRIAIIS